MMRWRGGIGARFIQPRFTARNPAIVRGCADLAFSAIRLRIRPSRGVCRPGQKPGQQRFIGIDGPCDDGYRQNTHVAGEALRLGRPSLPLRARRTRGKVASRSVGRSFPDGPPHRLIALAPGNDLPDATPLGRSPHRHDRSDTSSARRARRSSGAPVGAPADACMPSHTDQGRSFAGQ
jgi:hypothetical protein